MANARILVTADEWLAAPGIKEELAALGYEVVEAAASGQEILRLASEGPLDLVLMDINLPGDLDGIEAAEQLRRQFGIPMVFLTKCADPQTLARAMTTEPHGYLLKPFEVSELHAVIEMALSRSRVEKRLEESLSLHRATLESTADGILVVDRRGRIASFNKKFLDIWGIPEDLVQSRDDEQLLAFVLDRLADPQDFLKRVRELYAQPAAQSFEVIHFKDGRVFERLSRPQHQDGRIVGRVWSFRDVTSRVWTEQTLRKNEATLLGLFRAAPIGMGLMHNRIFAMVNEQMTRMTGYGAEELKGQSARMLYADEAEFDRVGTSKYPQMLDQGIDTVESVWRHKNGQLLNVLLSSSPLDLAGEKDGVVFTALDITARKQNEAAILQAKENWERTFNTIPDLIIILDTENRILQANQAMIHRLQAIPGEVVGRKCHQVVHNTQQPPAGCPHAQALKNGRTHTAEIWEENLGGVFLVTCSPLPDPEGKVVGTVHVARDITEQKRIEQELQQHRHHLEQLVAERTAALVEVNAELSREIAEHERTEKALRDSEARFRAIFEGAPLGIVLRDLQGEVIACNPALEKLLGYSQEEYNRLKFSFLHADDIQKTSCLFKELGRGERDYFIAENRAFHKEGHLVWGRLHASRVKGKDDRTWYTLSLIEDITREKEIQAEISAYQERLRALAAELTMTEERERRRLAADLHDNIGQVLALLQIKLGSLRQELPSLKMAADLDEARHILSQIITATRSLTLEMGLSVLHELGFAPGVEWLGETYQEQYGNQVEVSCEPLPPSLDRAQETFLFRAVRELLTNVTKHARAKRAAITVKTEDSQLILQVADDGVGFEVSNLTEVAGFGLFSIAERVSNQGGNMEVISAPGRGTTITITFALAEPF